MIETKTKNYQKILQLRGKLDIMVQQMNAEPETNLDSNAAKEALLVYHDDSDELNEELDEMLMPVSDTDNEDWEQDESSDDDQDQDDDEENGTEVKVNGIDGSSSEEEMDN